ncbi:MAG: hypothetical protein ACK4S6_16220 [Roseateles asaccharophilus]|uniref:hypothetical protein n=1 Tax=Roseateles asaccharophilus TaxID=582607 RepID=UPI00391BF1BB
MTQAQTLPQTLHAIVELAAAIVATTEALHAAGAIRPEAAELYGAVRTSIGQLYEQLVSVFEASQAAPSGNPDAQALAELRQSVETMALTLDDLADQVRALNTPAA